MRVIWTERLIAAMLALLLAVPAAAAPQGAAALPSAPVAQADAEMQPGQAEQSQGSKAQSSSQNGNAAPAVGTAAAPYEKAAGVTASRPAGAVIAPSKQHRVRKIFIRVGILAGAGAALVAVAVLARSSPSQPH